MSMSAPKPVGKSCNKATSALPFGAVGARDENRQAERDWRADQCERRAAEVMRLAERIEALAAESEALSEGGRIEGGHVVTIDGVQLPTPPAV
jgi:hypothetical protein